MKHTTVSFRTQVKVLTLGNIVAQGLVLGSLPLIAKLYPIREIGLYSVFAAIAATVLPASTLRLEYAIMIARRESTSRLMLLLAGLAALVGGAIFFLAIFVAQGFALGPWSGISLSSLVLCTLLLCASGLYAGSYCYACRTQRNGVAAGSRMASAFITVSTQLVLAKLAPSFEALLAADVAGKVIGLIVLSRSTAPAIRLVGSARLLRRCKCAIARFTPLMTYSSGSALLSSMASNLPTVLLASHYGAAGAAVYGLANRYITAPVALFGTSVSQTYLARIGRLLGNRERRPRLELFSRTSLGMLGLSLLLFLPLSCAAPSGVPWVLGDTWTSLGYAMLILCPLGIAQLTTSAVSGTLLATGRNHWDLAWTVARFSLVICTIMVCAKLEMPFLWCIGALAVVGTASYAVLYYLSWRGIRNYAAFGNSGEDEFAKTPAGTIA